MASGHQAPKPHKDMDPLWYTPESLQTPTMRRRRKVAGIVAILLATGGGVYKYQTDPRWESTIDAVFHGIGSGLELAAGRR